MKYIGYIVILMLFFSCDFIDFKKKEAKEVQPIATLFDANLYITDIANLLPNNLTKEDSLIFLKNSINKWAVKQLMLKKSLDNSSLDEIRQIDKLVENYKESLLINNYKEQLIKQQIDTLISDTEIDEYYASNKENFRLNEDLLKIRFIKFKEDLINKDEIISLFQSETLEDLETLEKHQLNLISHHLNDSIWLPLDKIVLKTTFSKEKLLKKSKFIQKKDSLDLYLIAVKDVLKRNSVAPKSYIIGTIKELILHQRKIQLIREIEQIIVKDAIQNKSLKIY